MNRKFFERNTLEVARDLLGCYLINGRCVGKIVETEAYLKDDPASHSFKGITKRNKVMFGEAGMAYVYFIYGNHFCFNVATAPVGVGEAVLIRALEPLKGINLMKKRRGKENILDLCSGPGKLCIALDIGKKHNGINLLKGKLRIDTGEKISSFNIERAKRVGLSHGKGDDLEIRFYIKENEFVSRKIARFKNNFKDIL